MRPLPGQSALASGVFSPKCIATRCFSHSARKARPERRNLLVCFDAFGTLFRPRESIANTYLRIAYECGIPHGTLKVGDVEKAFKAAFASNQKTHPNYGRTSGMRTSEWWTKVIHDTFTPLLPLHLAALRRSKSGHRVVTGVLTNSDDRVPGILGSLGFRVSPLRAGYTPSRAETDGRAFDIDFAALSYDVGAAKPDPAVFRAAEGLAARVVAGEEEVGRRRDVLGAIAGSGEWVRVYVGDEVAVDVAGAVAAGWNAVLVDPEGASGVGVEIGDDGRLGGRRWPDVLAAGDGTPVVVRAKSVQNALEWLMPS
ncbi:hypothetical protein B0T25DRAFT_128508 [Lasiosphaeria hispida]|uniref:Haloacid dehalogenase n=1 Tax=Lasiosphaeria hispida TaxID=260671 RepID=A0AAJ0HS73_9PEZI|nr:hypothetical protein B0T25DRAFT_128508 [Lasiosphaeria hispida]